MQVASAQHDTIFIQLSLVTHLWADIHLCIPSKDFRHIVLQFLQLQQMMCNTKQIKEIYPSQVSCSPNHKIGHLYHVDSLDQHASRRTHFRTWQLQLNSSLASSRDILTYRSRLEKRVDWLVSHEEHLSQAYQPASLPYLACQIATPPSLKSVL